MLYQVWVYICGFNIAILAGAVLVGGQQVVGIRFAAWVAIIIVVIYAIFVGAEASVVRAAVMAILMILATTMLGRPTFLPAVQFGAAFYQALFRSEKAMQTTVLKAGHHGSNTANGRQFLQAVNPQIVIISGGGERYDHPHEEVLGRIAETGSAVWRTDELGTIELISDGKLIWRGGGNSMTMSP